MQTVMEFFQFIWKAKEELLRLSTQHLALSFCAILIGAIVAVPLGIWAARNPGKGRVLIYITSVIYTVPSLALLGLLIPFLGLGRMTAITALFIYSLLPLIRNTFVGIAQVDPFVKEAAIGMGATRKQLLWLVELPMAFPFIMVGLRTVTVLTVGITTMGALVGAGGLGVLVFRGIHMMDNQIILAGTLPVALIAIFLDNIFELVQERITIVMGNLENIAGERLIS